MPPSARARIDTGMDSVLDDDAACRRHDPTLWDIDHAVHSSVLGRCEKCALALRICQTCPLRQRCRDEAIRHGDVYTIRGGWALVPVAPRRPERRAVPAPQCGHCSLPVLRGHGATFCSALCARFHTGGTPTNQPLAA